MGGMIMPKLGMMSPVGQLLPSLKRTVSLKIAGGTFRFVQ